MRRALPAAPCSALPTAGIPKRSSSSNASEAAVRRTRKRVTNTVRKYAVCTRQSTRSSRETTTPIRSATCFISTCVHREKTSTNFTGGRLNSTACTISKAWSEKCPSKKTVLSTCKARICSWINKCTSKPTWSCSPLPSKRISPRAHWRRCSPRVWTRTTFLPKRIRSSAPSKARLPASIFQAARRGRRIYPKRFRRRARRQAKSSAYS